MDIKKIKVATVAVIKRFQGYQLLKNPKGTSPYQLNMIKNFEGITSELDRFSHYDSVTIDYSSEVAKYKEKHLRLSRFMFWTKDKKEIKKSRIYYTTESGKVCKWVNKEIPIDEEEKILNSRDTSYIKKRRRNGTRNQVDLSMAFLGFARAKRVSNYESISETVQIKFFEKQAEINSKKNNSFWSILLSNLNCM